MSKLIPYIAVLCGIFLVGFSVWTLNLLGSPKHISHTPSAVKTSVSEVGFRFAAALNAQPPTTNKLIAEVACVESGDKYVCLFIGNSSGVIYCAGYKFTVTGNRVHTLNARRFSNAYCGL